MICRLLLNKLIETNLSLVVHSVFNEAINLKYDGELITLLSSSKPMQPFSLRCLKLPKVKEGDLIRLVDGVLVYDDWKIDLSKEEIFEPYYKPINKFLTKDEVNKNIETLGKKLKEAHKSIGVEPLVFNEELEKEKLFIKKDFDEFVNSIMNNDLQSIKECSKKVCGFGRGLTPSMDDFICGYMIGTYFKDIFLENNTHLDFNEELVNGLRDLTNSISYHMLQVSSLGLCNEYIKDLMDEILTKGNDIEPKFQKCIAFGESSGSDILCGVYVTFKAMM